MLETFLVFTKGGIVLWSIELLPPLAGAADADAPSAGVAAANTLVRDALLRNANVSSLTTRDHVIKFAVSNTADLVFVAVAGKAFGGAALAYVDALLASARDVFVERYGARLRAQVLSGGAADGMRGRGRRRDGRRLSEEHSRPSIACTHRLNSPRCREARSRYPDPSSVQLVAPQLAFVTSRIESSRRSSFREWGDRA